MGKLGGDQAEGDRTLSAGRAINVSERAVGDFTGTGSRRIRTASGVKATEVRILDRQVKSIAGSDLSDHVTANGLFSRGGRVDRVFHFRSFWFCGLWEN